MILKKEKEKRIVLLRCTDTFNSHNIFLLIITLYNGELGDD